MEHQKGSRVAAPAVVRRREDGAQQVLVLATIRLVVPRLDTLMAAHHKLEIIRTEELPGHIGAKGHASTADTVQETLVVGRIRPQRIAHQLFQKFGVLVARNGHQAVTSIGQVLQGKRGSINLVQLFQRGIRRVKQPSVQHNHSLVHHRKQRQLLENLHEQAEDNVAVFLAALQLKAIYCADRKVLVVAAVQDHVIWQSDVQGEKRTHDLHSVAASVHEVPIENVLVRLAWQSSGLQNMQQVWQLAM
mmetsp:Transcript_54563/g.95385  ORF Transcript_54563/g.95385 Transcript_54563/m.95385 type:complete len:247 (-) Transcript_54563:1460-2200(-)